MQTTIGLLVGIALGTFVLVALWLVMRFARGTHHGRRIGGQHAAPAASLFITASGGKVFRFDLTSSPVRVGRAPDNDLVITTAMPGWDTVSRNHARLYYDVRLNRWVVRDEGSRNGTYVNGVRTGHNVLRDGVRLSLGSVEALFREAG